MKTPLLLLRWVLLGAALLLGGQAQAQSYGYDTTRVYSFVEQMPALPSGGGNLALVKAVQRQLQLPAEVREGRVEGYVYVRVVIGVSGVGRQAAVVQSLSPTCDAAALAAVRKLPRLVPGRYNGVPVATMLTIPVVFYSPRHVYATNELTRTAQYPGGDEALRKFVAKNQQLPTDVRDRSLRGPVGLRLVVRADGSLGATEIVQSLCPRCDEEALRLVRAMPRWVPARGYDDQPVASYQTLSIWFEPPADAPANVPENQIYAFAQTMPELPTGGGMAALTSALQEAVEPPARPVEGQVQVSFVVEPDGRVSRPAIVRSLDRSCDEAVLAGVMRLPRLRPAQHQGRPVAVRLTLPVEFAIR